MRTDDTSVGGISLSGYIFNAAGPKDATYEELLPIGKSDSVAITMKSCTLEPREGNPEPRYAFTPDPYGSISASGLPNLGYKAYVDLAATMKHEFPSKPVVASVAGLTFDDFAILVEAFQNSEADLIEVNLHSCPKEKDKPQLAHDVQSVEKVLTSIMTLGDKPVGLKLPMYSDSDHIERLAAVFKKHAVAFVSTVSSVSPALVIDPETETAVIKPKSGMGGMGGAYVKPFALANVRAFAQSLRDTTVSVIGVGGVRTGKDVFEFLLAGADAVQIGTTFYEEGPGCFKRIAAEFTSLMESKGYNSVSDAKGKLKLL
jgi:dihydroorotate dehydrogenase (fumarate)